MKFEFLFGKKSEPPKRESTPEEKEELRRRVEAERLQDETEALARAEELASDPKRRAEARIKGGEEAEEARGVFESLELEEKDAFFEEVRREAGEVTYPELGFHDFYLSKEEMGEYRDPNIEDQRRKELRNSSIVRRAAALAMEVKGTEDKTERVRKEEVLYRVLEERISQVSELADEGKRIDAMKNILGAIGALGREHSSSILKGLLRDKAFRVLVTKDDGIFQKVAVMFEYIPREHVVTLLENLASGEGIKDKKTRDALAALPGRFKEHVKEVGEAEVARLQQEIESGVVNGAELREIEHKAKRRAELVDKFALTEKNRNASLKWQKFGDSVMGGMAKVGVGGLNVLKWGALSVGALAAIAVLGPIALGIFVAKYIVENGLKGAGRGKH
ncbi:MAG: hypothetical protein HZA35_01010 [Parcubacteria group bacterium]|nr:hypothetical protein [Parcubacteria group bacterium]